MLFDFPDRKFRHEKTIENTTQAYSSISGIDINRCYEGTQQTHKSNDQYIDIIEYEYDMAYKHIHPVTSPIFLNPLLTELEVKTKSESSVMQIWVIVRTYGCFTDISCVQRPNIFNVTRLLIHKMHFWAIFLISGTSETA